MNAEQFTYFWKIALLVILIVGIFFLGYEMKDLNMKGIDCLKRPPCPISLYQQEQEVGQAQAEFLERLEKINH